MDLPRIDLNEYINWILLNFSFNNQWQADRVLKKHYETTFGIFDHRVTRIGNTRPWSGMAHLPGNSPGKYYDVDYLMAKYENNSIWDVLHISYHEYIQYPPHKMTEMDNKCRSIKEARVRADNDQSHADQKAMANALKGMTPT